MNDLMIVGIVLLAYAVVLMYVKMTKLAVENQNLRVQIELKEQQMESYEKLLKARMR